MSTKRDGSKPGDQPFEPICKMHTRRETMKLQSGGSVTVDILGSAEKLVWDIIAQVLWSLAFVAFVAAAPVLYFFFGLFCARSGDTTFPTIYVFTSPLPAAVWTLF